LRFIPTRVGNRPSTVDVSLLIAVHPHACGEQAAGGVVGRTWQRFIPTRVGNRARRPVSGTYLRGLAPRGWGTGRAERVGLRDHRFIPTRVGNSSTPPRRSTRPPGSSPRVWGTEFRTAFSD